MKRPEWELAWERWDCNQVISRLRRRQKGQVCPFVLIYCWRWWECPMLWGLPLPIGLFSTFLHLTFAQPWIWLEFAWRGEGVRCPGWWSGSCQSTEHFRPLKSFIVSAPCFKIFIVSAPCRRVQFWSHMQIAHTTIPQCEFLVIWPGPKLHT